ncbi:MAG: hypothetical protein KatS3mg057_1620 [Herpetosiphonaceae bacterium]|nr:MAG: hypothetical protein KatS3mg057_1620 [Herpetosiphonaceae bacterium]
MRRKRLITVYRARTEITMLADEDILDGADVIPGWRIPVHQLFA